MCAEAAESGGSEQEVREGSLGVKHGTVHDRPLHMLISSGVLLVCRQQEGIRNG